MPWVAIMTVDNRVGIGCVACCKSNNSNTNFARFAVRTPKSVIITNLKKHEGSEVHCQAVAEWFGMELPSQKKAAPSTDEFQAVWNVLKTEKSVEAAAAPMFRSKVQKKAYCLGEAVRIMDRSRNFSVSLTTLFKPSLN